MGGPCPACRYTETEAKKHTPTKRPKKMKHLKKPHQLAEAVAYHFHQSSADRQLATDKLVAEVRRKRSPATYAYLLEKGCRQLVHEYARAERERTPAAKDLMHYPVCTSKYLKDANQADLTEEIETHDSLADTNARKAEFFMAILRVIQSDLDLPDSATVAEVLTEDDLQGLYKLYIWSTENDE